MMWSDSQAARNDGQDGHQVMFSELPEDFETMGLMQCAPELYADGVAVSYIQLCALDCARVSIAALQLPVEKQIEHFQNYDDGRYDSDEQLQYMCAHYQKVLQFLSGIRKFSGYSGEVLNIFMMGERELKLLPCAGCLKHKTAILLLKSRGRHTIELNEVWESYEYLALIGLLCVPQQLQLEYSF